MAVVVQKKSFLAAFQANPEFRPTLQSDFHNRRLNYKYYVQARSQLNNGIIPDTALPAHKQTKINMAEVGMDISERCEPVKWIFDADGYKRLAMRAR